MQNDLSLFLAKEMLFPLQKKMLNVKTMHGMENRQEKYERGKKGRKENSQYLHWKTLTICLFRVRDWPQDREGSVQRGVPGQGRTQRDGGGPQEGPDLRDDGQQSQARLHEGDPALTGTADKKDLYRRQGKGRPCCLGGQNLFTSLPRQLLCTRMIRRKGRIEPG